MGNMGMRELGELIRDARERKNLRAYDLSYAIGQNPSWLSRLERGDLTHPPAPSVMDGLSTDQEVAALLPGVVIAVPKSGKGWRG